MTTQVKIAAFLHFNSDTSAYQCEGSWSIGGLGTWHEAFELTMPRDAMLTIHGENIQSFDSAGALALQHVMEMLREQGNEVTLVDFSKQQLALLELVQQHEEAIEYHAPPKVSHSLLYRIGFETFRKITQVEGILNLVGDLCTKVIEICYRGRGLRMASIVSNIYSAGIQALPIVALLSFLIGIVLAYQMGLQLQTYGANTLIAYLAGSAIFREFASLITAIIVAGRTSSAFTAQIGSMVINEEIDALHTMGLSSTSLLVVPKVLALLVAFPLLIFWADCFSLLGAMFMSSWMLHIGFFDFLARLRVDVGLQPLLLGIYKAPAFALIIALVGCFQGFSVAANTDSIGSQTTKSVVQALFLIIITDAIYSVIYSWMNL